MNSHLVSALCVPDFNPKLWEKPGWKRSCPAQVLRIWNLFLPPFGSRRATNGTFGISGSSLLRLAGMLHLRGKKIFCGQSPFSKLVGFSAGVPRDVEKIPVQGIQKFLNSLIHVEFNMDILGLSLWSRNIHERVFGRILSWGVVIDALQVGIFLPWQRFLLFVGGFKWSC